MVQPVQHTWIVSLYESQNSPWHPMGWPARILAAPCKRGMNAFVEHDTFAPPTAAVARSVGQKMARGALNMATSPVGLAASQPGPIVLFGTAAPTAVLGLLNGSALLVGSGGLSTAQWMPKLLSRVFDRSRPADAPHPAWQVALSHVVAYGAVGCLTECLGALVGRLGHRLRSQPQANFAQRTAGFGLEILGYSAAILCGAVLTVARLAIATLLTGFNLAAMPFAAAIGALWALGQHLLGLDTDDNLLAEDDPLHALQREAVAFDATEAAGTAPQPQPA